MFTWQINLDIFFTKLFFRNGIYIQCFLPSSSLLISQIICLFGHKNLNICEQKYLYILPQKSYTRISGLVCMQRFRTPCPFTTTRSVRQSIRSQNRNQSFRMAMLVLVAVTGISECTSGSGSTGTRIWSKWSACAALGRCCGTKCPLYLVLFFFSFFCVPHTFFPEGVVLGFVKFCTEFLVIKK